MILPGLIDAHVHLRTPGQEYKENFLSGTSAALAGGFTTILDMPNNLIPVTSYTLLKQKINLAKKQIVGDIGFYLGSINENQREFNKVKKLVFGLKLYLNQTTGNFLISDREFEKIINSWPQTLPILIHAEEDMLERVFQLSSKYQKRIHVCHVSSKKELKIIIKAKKNGQNITCGVTPHHLFLNKNNLKIIGPFGIVKPYLKPQTDIDFLWANLKQIDIIESDHAPHTRDEKESSNPPFGIAGLETTLALLLTAKSQGRISIDDIVRMCFKKPAETFNIKTHPKTEIEVDENEEWIVDSAKFFTKCKTSPFNGMKLCGKVKRAYIRGLKVFEDGKILVKPGSGKIIKPLKR